VLLPVMNTENPSFLIQMHPLNADLDGGTGDDTLEDEDPDSIGLIGGLGADHFDCGGYSQWDVKVHDFNPGEGDTKSNCPGL
jgi:hypothetical protein